MWFQRWRTKQLCGCGTSQLDPTLDLRLCIERGVYRPKLQALSIINKSSMVKIGLAFPSSWLFSLHSPFSVKLWGERTSITAAVFWQNLVGKNFAVTSSSFFEGPLLTGGQSRGRPIGLPISDTAHSYLVLFSYSLSNYSERKNRDKYVWTFILEKKKTIFTCLLQLLRPLSKWSYWFYWRSGLVTIYVLSELAIFFICFFVVYSLNRGSKSRL